MLSGQRKQLILDILARDKQVLSKELSQRFNISEDSIRRDLREMAAEGLLQRVHGGALAVSAATGTLEMRKSVQIESKKRVAQKAVGLIQPGNIVIIDGGTTSQELIKLLPGDLAFTAVTHSPTVAVGLLNLPLVDVIVIGGQLYKHSAVTVGASMIESINRIHADLFFMGVTGVHETAGFTTGNYEEANVKRALSQRAAETVVMASAEKINSASPFAIGELSIASTLLVDGTLDEKMRTVFNKLNITVL
ncbi:DeoR family transcriptional regulator [Mangrovibacter phragmitis]|uniref:DeoR family transcriptional regulator n=1 Tax=Mangrovibacter phragmitis TaxID=1691903 RepID=A0A1B7L966_9ENTR|nr:DeoR/GlpR family DNA-binding transcription regulator [Mangrovibacter phragmitis]OAT78761.1 DeoR family transcriptional regulator [Mangrovibacter phragmitis]